MIRKKVGILFTSGLDSTYLVWKNLEEGNIVYLLYIKVDNNPVKTEAELYSIQKLFGLFANKYGYDRIYDCGQIAIVGGGIDYIVDLVQSIMWLFGLQFIQKKDFDEIQIAYVMNDDAISYLDEIKAVYKSYQGLTSKRSGTNDRWTLIPLTFPLTKYHKREMVIELPHVYREYIYSCEDPIVAWYDACGNKVESPSMAPGLIPISEYNEQPKKRYYSCGRCHTCTRYNRLAQDFSVERTDYPLLYVLDEHEKHKNKDFGEDLKDFSPQF